MFGALDFLKIGVGAIAGAAIAYQVGHWSGERAGRAALTAEMQTAAQTAETERAADDAERKTLSDRDLCVRALRARGMPVDTCAGLRGVSRGQP
ncbi:hypothetical protein [Aureimonas sp. AU12]|uniref:hypothetical protein n=1 Tax=Aureimonas sp. AU12 TaxID=1638161 RepID=UPI000781A825|nr:hypothetical protein [Aureimonas sp. AU12]